MRMTLSRVGRRQLMAGVNHKRQTVLLLPAYVAQMIYYLVVQTASQYQAIEQERLHGPQII